MTPKRKKPKPPRRVEYHVVPFYQKGLLWWQLRRSGRMLQTFSDKTAAVCEAIRVARAEQCASVRAHRRDGRIQWERSYPRKYDPRKTKG